jgi:hypothetical protein
VNSGLGQSGGVVDRLLAGVALLFAASHLLREKPFICFEILFVSSTTFLYPLYGLVYDTSESHVTYSLMLGKA